MGDIHVGFVLHILVAHEVYRARYATIGGMLGPSFNHAMVYSRDVATALRFYVDLLGLKLLQLEQYSGRAVYARVKSARGNATIALHLLEPGQEFHPGAIRLYFEVPDLKKFCKRLEKGGGVLSQQPKKMPWGWTHAYLNDPDGHEVSVYSAGAKRLKKTHSK
jgi:predicted enzyme related to lactoylglutathione lyase